MAALPAWSIEFISTNRFAVASNETVQSELWVQAQNVDLAGTAEKDVFVFALAPMSSEDAAPALRLTGSVLGDLWAVAQNIELRGTLNRNARLLGAKTITVSDKVAGNLVAAGNAVHVDETADIGGDLLAVARDIIADGHTHGDVRLMGTHVTLAGTFDRDITVTAAEITVMPGTRIGRDFRYLSDKDLVLDSNVSLGRNMIRLEPAPSSAGSSAGSSLLFQLALYASSLLGGLALIGLFPGLVALSAQKLSESVWRTVLLGFVAFCLVPMTAILLFVTLVGIPLSLTILLAYLVAVYFSKVPVALCLGALAMRRRDPQTPLPVFPALALGLLLMYAAVSLPFPIDFILWFAFTFAGLGALAGASLDRRIPAVVRQPASPEVQPPPLPPEGNLT